MNNLEKTCPMCEEGTLTPTARTTKFEYRGSDLVVDDLEVSTCSLCDSELVLPEQSKKNQVTIADKKRSLDGLLTSVEIVAFRKKYKLTQVVASTIFGGGTNAFSKYERGDTIQSVAMDRLIRLANENSIILYRLKEIAGIESEADLSLIIKCDYNEPCIISMQQPTAPLEGSVIKRKQLIENTSGWKAAVAA